MASSPTESPQQRERIAVRHGASLAHCADPEVAARLMLSLQRLPRAAAGRTGMDGTEIVEAAILATRLLGSETVARGLALLRCAGRRMPGHLARDLRALDAAAALLRHPGAAQRVVARLEAWLAGAASADGPSRDGSEDDGDALVGAGRSSDASLLPSAHRGAETCTEADSVDVAGADAGAGAAHRQRSLEEFGFVQHVQATGETGPTNEQPSDVPVAASCFDIYDTVREAAVQTDTESTTIAFDGTFVRDEHVAGSASGSAEPGVGGAGNLTGSEGSKGLSKRAKKKAAAAAKLAEPLTAASPAAQSPAKEAAAATGGASRCGNAWAGCEANDDATAADAQRLAPFTTTPVATAAATAAPTATTPTPPTAAAFGAGALSVEERYYREYCRELCEKHNSPLLDHLPALFRKYPGRTGLLYSKLCDKFNDYGTDTEDEPR